MNQSTVLCIAQTAKLMSALSPILEAKKIRLCQAETWARAQVLIQSDPPHLIVLDCPGTGVDGLAACQEIRALFHGPLVLVADEEDERFHAFALGLGVDVSLVRSADALLVSAYIKALLRRFSPVEPPAIQTFGTLTVDANKRDVLVADQAARLSTIEFNLFRTLVNHIGQVVSREDIHRQLYNTPYNGYDRNIDLYISRIRQKIGDDPSVPRYLKTVRGVGYQFVGG